VRFEILRDPVWNNIRSTQLTLKLVDTEARSAAQIRTPARLDLPCLPWRNALANSQHALGTHHLSRRTLRSLAKLRNPASIGEIDQGD